MKSGRQIVQAFVDSGKGEMAALSRKAGKNPAYIQQFLKRNTPFELPEKVRHAIALDIGVHPDALREVPLPSASVLPPFQAGSDVQPARDVEIPGPRTLSLEAKCEVRGVVEAGADGQFEVNLSEGPLEYVDLPGALVGVPDLFALFVAGESMAGVWMPGDVVFVSRRRPVTQNAYVVVLVENEKGQPPRAFLKQFVSKDSKRVKLRQFNPDMAVEFETISVREMWRALHWREWAA